MIINWSSSLYHNQDDHSDIVTDAALYLNKSLYSLLVTIKKTENGSAFLTCMEEQSESIRYNDSMFNENTMLVLLIVHTYMYSSAFELTTTSKKKASRIGLEIFFSTK